MRPRVALAAALLCIVGVFVIEMSGSARRLSGTNHIDPLDFVVTVPANGRVCQPIAFLPADTGAVKFLIGTYGRPLPDISSEFVAGGEVLAAGALPAGGKQGYVAVPLRYSRQSGTQGTICLRFGGDRQIALGGEPLAASPSSATVNGTPSPAGLALYYLRKHPESWWQMLPTLAQRFGFGKAALFGNWTLPAAAMLLLATWVGAIRLLYKEVA